MVLRYIGDAQWTALDADAKPTNAAVADTLTTLDTRRIFIHQGSAVWIEIGTGTGGGGGGGGGFAAGGSIAKSGDGTSTIISIAHGLSPTPDLYYALPLNAASRGIISYGIDGTNINLTYPIAPASGASNLSYVWGAGYVNSASGGLTPTSTTTMTGKTISGESNTLPFLGVETKWTIYQTGTVVKARNNITGIIDYTNTSGNIDPVLNSIINAISPAGTPTKIVIAEGDYKLAALWSIDSTRIGNICIQGAGRGLTNLIGQSTITGISRMIDFRGAVSGTQKNLTANAVIGQGAVTVSAADSATFAVGDYVLLRSDKLWTTGGGAIGKQGEIRKVFAINTGTGVITLDGWLYDTYNTVDTANIIKLSMLQNMTLEGITIKPSATYTATSAFFRGYLIDGLVLREVEIIDSKGQYSSGFSIMSCLNFQCNPVYATQTVANAHNLQYGIHISAASQHGKVYIIGRGLLRHTATTGGVSGADFSGVQRDITISGTSESTSESHWDTHEDAEGISFIGCHSLGPSRPVTSDFHRGLTMRAKNVIIEGCVIMNPIGAGISFNSDSSGAIIKGNKIYKLRKTPNGISGYDIWLDAGITDCVIQGNVIMNSDAVYSIYLAGGNNDTVISGNVIKNSKLIRGTDSLDVVVTGNRCNNGTSQRFISMSGTSDYWLIVGNNSRNCQASTTVGANNTLANNIAF